MKSKTKYVYVVKQYQPEADYDGETIYVYTKEENAVQAARNLNKTYGKGCNFSIEGDFENYIDYYLSHYYTVESIIMDDHIPELEKYYDEFVIETNTGYVAKKDMYTNNIDNAMSFNTWDQARAMVEVLEKTDIYPNDHLLVRGINNYD